MFQIRRGVGGGAQGGGNLGVKGNGGGKSAEGGRKEGGKWDSLGDGNWKKSEKFETLHV